jgi:hypothetical protein
MLLCQKRSAKVEEEATIGYAFIDLRKRIK